MVAFNVVEASSATYTADLVDQDESPIVLNDLTSITLTLRNKADQVIINGRDNQNILNANDVTITAGGQLTWNIQSADNAIINYNIPDGTREIHEAVFEFTYNAGTQSGNHVIEIHVLQTAEVGTIGVIHYGSTGGGDIYFQYRLNSDPWDDASAGNKLAALIEATRLIDNLNFKGSKKESTQDLEFPRASDAGVPENIINAAYEIALKLLDDYDPDLEVETLQVVSQRYANVGETYDRKNVPEHLVSGIPSFRAWAYIKPYLRDPHELKLTRVS